MVTLTFKSYPNKRGLGQTGGDPSGMDLRYRNIEAALTTVLEVHPKRIGAFRARLRHLRNVGLPSGLPNPGSGQQIAYSQGQALEMLIALVLEELGQAPKAAAALSASIIRQSTYREDLTNHHPLGDMYAVMQPEKAPFTMFYGNSGLKEFFGILRRRWRIAPPPKFAMINVTAHAKLLDRALMKVLYERRAYVR